MYRKLIFFSLIVIIAFSFFSYFGFSDGNETPNISEESQMCIECHENYTPGIVEDWRNSRHSKITLNQAFGVDEISRRISIKELNGKNGDIIVACYECHSLNPDSHKDNFEHFGYKINSIVSPVDCSTCHIQEYDEYKDSKKAHALDILRKNKTYSTLVDATLQQPIYSHGKLTNHPASENKKNETCYHCHGTEVEVKGLKTIETEVGDIEVPNLTNYPNQGVGRINPDGSKGSCTSCHPRHSFSIEVARKPETCAQCHLEPDVPAYNVYIESKHGNIYKTKGKNWDYNSVPWKLGVDFTTPTCATCHNSLLVDSQDRVIQQRTHDFGTKLWKRIFGLVYSHNQPINGRTYEIMLENGTQIPTSLDRKEVATNFLISDDEAKARESEMKNLCKNCHSSQWADGYFEKFDKTVKEADDMVEETTKIMFDYWKKNKGADNPFDDYIEKMWVKQWLYYANSVRYASAMSGPDYAAFKNGWYEMNSNLLYIHKLMLNQK